jgi:hypothetical protein
MIRMEMPSHLLPFQTGHPRWWWNESRYPPSWWWLWQYFNLLLCQDIRNLFQSYLCHHGVLQSSELHQELSSNSQWAPTRYSVGRKGDDHLPSTHYDACLCWYSGPIW